MQPELDVSFDPPWGTINDTECLALARRVTDSGNQSAHTEQQAYDVAMLALQDAKETGDGLLVLFEAVGREGWVAFAKANIPLPKQQVADCVRIARHWPIIRARIDAGDKLSIKGALHLIRMEK